MGLRLILPGTRGKTFECDIVLVAIGLPNLCCESLKDQFKAMCKTGPYVCAHLRDLCWIQQKSMLPYPTIGVLKFVCAYYLVEQSIINEKPMHVRMQQICSNEITQIQLLKILFGNKFEVVIDSVVALLLHLLLKHAHQTDVINVCEIHLAISLIS